MTLCRIIVNTTCRAYQQPNCQGEPANIDPQFICAQGICLNCVGLNNSYAIRVARDEGFQAGCTENGCKNIANYTVVSPVFGCQNLFFDKSIFCAASALSLPLALLLVLVVALLTL